MLYITKADRKKLEDALRLSDKVRETLVEAKLASPEKFGLDDVFEAFIMAAAVRNVRLIDSRKVKND